ncbi:hypothetical protein [Caldicellulosiruptor owensensis]|nr:hypothetical protein [Caldicellulosiruptor owensensis]
MKVRDANTNMRYDQDTKRKAKWQSNIINANKNNQQQTYDKNSQA